MNHTAEAADKPSPACTSFDITASSLYRGPDIRRGQDAPTTGDGSVLSTAG